MTGGEIEALRVKWDERYGDSTRTPEPAAVLAENLHILPRRGTALDLACGIGPNALLLAAQGLDVSAWDLSPVAIQRLERSARERGLRVAAEARDVQERPPQPQSFDVIVVTHFLERSLSPALVAALRPGGVLFFQTFSREAVTDCGPSDPEYRLAVNELLSMFHGLVLRFYREEGRVGDLSRGTRDLAQLIAQKPA